MSDWKAFIEEAEIEAKKILGSRERKMRDESVYAEAWRTLDFCGYVREARLRGEIDAAMNMLFLACDAFIHMQVMRGVPEYNGYPVPLIQLMRDANRGVKGIRADRKATKKGAPMLNRIKGQDTIDILRSELEKRNWTPVKRGIAKQLIGVSGLPKNVTHMRRLISRLRAK